MRYSFEMAAAGNFLFRWRSYFPLLLLPLLLWGMHKFEYLGDSHTTNLMWGFLCLCVSGIGIVIRAITIGKTPRDTSGGNTRSQVAASLNTTGIYSIVRHPLYLGNFFMWLGVAMFPHQWIVVLVVVLAFWLYYERIAMREEQFLAEKFGSEYWNWAGKTPAFVPSFKNYTPSSMGFSFRTVLKREYYGALGVVFSMSLLELLGDFLVTGTVITDPFWVTLLSITLISFVTLRLLKKHTTVLQVPGR